MGIQEHDPEFWAFLTQQAENDKRDRERERQTFVERHTCPNCFHGPWNCDCTTGQVECGRERLRVRRQADWHRRLRKEELRSRLFKEEWDRRHRQEEDKVNGHNS